MALTRGALRGLGTSPSGCRLMVNHLVWDQELEVRFLPLAQSLTFGLT